jgi:hypothetical protein
MLTASGNDTHPDSTDGSPGWLSNRNARHDTGHWFSVAGSAARWYSSTASVQRTFAWYPEYPLAASVACTAIWNVAPAP